MSIDLYRLEFHNFLQNLTQKEIEFVQDYQVEDGTFYIEEDHIEQAIEDKIEVPERILKLYKKGAFKEGVSFIISY